MKNYLEALFILQTFYNEIKNQFDWSILYFMN